MIEVIASMQNAKIKLAASLKQKKYRDETGMFLAEGLRLCEEAVKSDVDLAFCVYRKAEAADDRMKTLLESLEERQCPIYQVSKQIYDKISDTKEPQGILLVLHQFSFSLEDLRMQNGAPFLVVLDGLQDPGNLGTIVRSADAAGCTGIVLMKNTVDLFSSKVVRATMGSAFHLPIVENMDVEALAAFLTAHHIQLFVTALDAQAKSYFAVDFTESVAVVFGNEGNGVNEAFLTKCDEKILIPMHGKAESLNVSTAAAVVIYEGFRQRFTVKS